MVQEPSAAIASVFGPFMVVLGVWMLLFSKNLVKIWSSLKSTPSAFFLMGMMNLLIGIYIVNQYNYWSWNKTCLVTLLGWFVILRGALALFVPQALVKYTMGDASVAKVIGLIPLIWGLILCWIAFA